MNYLEILNEHFRLEFDLRKNFQKSFIHINESHGAYNGQVQLVKDISEYIDSNRDSDTFELNGKDLSDYENIFFNKLIIYYSDTETHTYYDNKSEYDKNSKMMKKIAIHLKTSENSTYNELLTNIMHELTHAWDDYNSHLKGSQYSLKDLTNKESKYYELVHDNKITLENICKDIEYSLSKIKQNAYLSELNISLYKSKVHIKNYEDAVEHIKSDEVFTRYTTLFDFIKSLDESKFEKFTKVYNDTMNTQLSSNQLKKNLLNRFDKVFKKLSSRLPKIYADYVEDTELNRIKENAGLTHNSMNIVEYLKCHTDNVLEKYIKK